MRDPDTSRKPVPDSQALAIIRAGRRPDLAQLIDEHGPAMDTTTILDDRFIDLARPIPNERHLTLHTWTFAQRPAIRIYVLIETVADLNELAAFENIVVTEYDLTDPQILAAVTTLTAIQ